VSRGELTGRALDDVRARPVDDTDDTLRQGSRVQFRVDTCKANQPYTSFEIIQIS
jgi:ribosomal protein S3AE